MNREIKMEGSPFFSLTAKGNIKKAVIAVCHCGNKWEANYYQLTCGYIKSCGCSKKEAIERNRAANGGIYNNGRTTHGLTNHPLYSVWASMRQRCYDSSLKVYKYYGGKGISVCPEWKTDFINFYNWSILNGWIKGLHLDRINNDGNYDPINCRYVTSKINMRNTSKKIEIKYKGEKKTLADWSDELKIPYSTLYNKVIIQRHSMNDVVNGISHRKKKERPKGVSPEFHIKVKNYLKENGKFQRWLVNALYSNEIEMNDYKLSEKLNGNMFFTKEEAIVINKILNTNF